MNVGIITAYPEPIGFNHGVLQFCKHVQSLESGVTPVIIAMTRHPLKENSLVIEGRRLGLHVEVLHERFRYDPQVFTDLLKIIDRLDLQLLDVQTYKPLVLGLFARRLRPHVFIISWVHGFTQENFKVRLFGTVERCLHKFTDRVICVSKPFADGIEKEGVKRENIRIIPNAIGDEEFENSMYPNDLIEQLGLEKGVPVVGAVGRLSPEKGHTYLIKAWAEIHRVIPNARLVIVGDGPCMRELQHEVESFELQDSVSFTGFRSDGRRYFGIFDVMVLPSLDEGLPYVLLEAMIKEVPVVASAVGEVPAVLEYGRLGRLVTPGDCDAIALSVIDLIKSPAEMKLIKNDARASVLSQYSHKIRTNKIVDVYQQVTGLNRN